MEKTITFHTSTEDKELIRQFAQKERLSDSSFCRFVILNKIKEMQKND